MNIYMICTLWTPFQAERDWKNSYREILFIPLYIFYSLCWESRIAWKLNLLIKKLAWEPSIAWKLNLLIKKLAWEPSIAWKLNLLIKKLAWEPSIAWNLDLLFKASLLNLKFSNPLFNLVLCFSCLEVERPLLNY